MCLMGAEQLHHSHGFCLRYKIFGLVMSLTGAPSQEEQWNRVWVSTRSVQTTSAEDRWVPTVTTVMRMTLTTYSVVLCKTGRGYDGY